MRCIYCKKTQFSLFCQAGKYTYFKCQNCSAIVMGKFPGQKELNEIYSYAHPKNVSQTNTALNLFIRIPLVEKTLHLHGDLINSARAYSVSKMKEKGVLLDIGAGPGTFLQKAKSLGWKTYGTEMGQKLITSLKKKFGSKSIFSGEVQNIKFGKNKFDVITFWHVFEHIANIDSVLKVALKQLKKDGYLVIEVPHAQSLLFKLFKNNWALLMEPQHLHFGSEKSFEKLFKRHGLQVVKIEHPPHFIFVLFSSLVKVNKSLLLLTPILIPISIIWVYLTSLIKKGDVIRVYATKS